MSIRSLVSRVAVEGITRQSVLGRGILFLPAAFVAARLNSRMGASFQLYRTTIVLHDITIVMERTFLDLGLQSRTERRRTQLPEQWKISHRQSTQITRVRLDQNVQILLLSRICLFEARDATESTGFESRCTSDDNGKRRW